MTANFNFILLNNSANSFFSTTDAEENSTANTSNEVSLLTNTNNENGCTDAFGGKDMFGTFDASNMDSNFFASAETAGSVACGSETAGSVAYGSETAGSIACGSETAGSVACSSGSGSCDSGSFSSVC